LNLRSALRESAAVIVNSIQLSSNIVE
jgi:hypothetical protein